MTIEELKQHRLFKLLQNKEPDWVLEYISSGGDVDRATQKVFEPATKSSHTTWKRRMLTEPRVALVLNLWHGELEDQPTLDDYLKELWRAAREAKGDAAKAALFRLYGEARGWIKPAPGKQVSQPGAVSPADILKQLANDAAAIPPNES